MKTVLRLLLSISVFGLCASAQQEDLPVGDFFLGYTALHSGSSSTILSHTSMGGVGTFGWNINEHVGIEAEAGGYHNGFVDSFHDDTNTVTYLFGPRLSYGRMKRVDPYFHVLLGGIHTATSVLKQPAATPLPVGGSSRYTLAQDEFALAIGGGVDIKLNKNIAFRPIQLDCVLPKLGKIGPTGLSPNSFQSDFRYSVGFLFHIE